MAGGVAAICASEEEARGVRDFIRPHVALYVGGMGAKSKNFYNTLFRRYGYEAEAEKIQDLYLDGKKDEAAALVPDDFMAATNLVGTEGFIKDRIAAFDAAGVTHLQVHIHGPDAVDTVARIKQWTN